MSYGVALNGVVQQIIRGHTTAEQLDMEESLEGYRGVFWSSPTIQPDC